MVSSAVVDPIASILRTTRSTRSGKPVNDGFASLAPTAPLRSRLRRRAGSRGCGARHGRDRRSRGSDEAAGLRRPRQPALLQRHGRGLRDKDRRVDRAENGSEPCRASRVPTGKIQVVGVAIKNKKKDTKQL